MKTLIRSAALLALALGLATVLAAQDKAKKPAAKPNPPDEKAMMEAMTKAATPGEGQKKLEPLIGTFDVSMRMYMDPSKPPVDSTGTAVNTWVLGNRYVEEKFDGTFMEQPFTGLGYTGYDNVTKKYVGTWMDTAATGMMWSTGSVDASGKVMSAKSSMADPMTGKTSAITMKTTITDADHHTMEMWGAGPDGKTMKMMEITYTRKK